MHKNSHRRSTFSPLLQKIKAPEHQLRLEDEHDESDNHIQLPSLPRQRSWKDDSDIMSNGNSAATSISWSQEADAAIQRLEEQWTSVEKSFYEEDDQQLLGSILDECIQWRTQIPYLRLIGRNSVYSDNSKHLDLGSNDITTKKFDDLQNDELMEYNLSAKEKEDSIYCKLKKAKFEDVFDMIMEYVISELFLNKENDTNVSCKDLSDALQITPASIHNNRNLSKSSKTNWSKKGISRNCVENKPLSTKDRLLETESFLQTPKKDANHQGVQRRQRNSVSANKPREFSDMDDDSLGSKERLYTPHIGRNKLGTVFNKRIVVNPVPFAVSTRESFSTLKTAPVRFMSENLKISSFQGSAQNISDFWSSGKRSSFLSHTDIHSVWEAPVCPAVWPKNIRLAPIDASRFPNRRNRSLATPSPTILHCNKKALSPISHVTVPYSAQSTMRDCKQFLDIQEHIVPVESSKISLLSAGRKYNTRMVKDKKKKPQTKERFREA